MTNRLRGGDPILTIGQYYFHFNSEDEISGQYAIRAKSVSRVKERKGSISGMRVYCDQKASAPPEFQEVVQSQR